MFNVRLGGAVAAVALGAYAWLMTGATPFTFTSYVLVAFPCVALLTAFVSVGGFSKRTLDVSSSSNVDRRRHGSVTPWIVLLSAALALETIGLALGGHSTSVPTLSTTIDHLLARHWERFFIGTAWLLMGAALLAQLGRQRLFQGARP